MPDPITPPGLVAQWMYSTLAADSALQALVGTRIYGGIAPEGSTYPLITFNSVSGVDTTALGFHRVLTQARYDVHMADRVGSILGLDRIAGRVDALLHGKTYQWAEGALMLGALREDIIERPGAIAGVQTRELIATYLVVVREASAA